MRVQTSGMPKRCIGGRDSDYRLLDFSVKFQPKQDPRKRVIKDQAEYDEIACDPHEMVDVPQSSKVIFHQIFPSYGQTLDDLIGVAIDGVPIKASPTPQRLDPFFPKSWSGSKAYIAPGSLDSCLGSVDPDSYTYSYTLLSPCLQNHSGIDTNLSCANVTECTSDLRKYSKSNPP